MGKHHENVYEAAQVKKTLHRDLVGLFSALVIAVVSAFFLDTGSLADWVGKHKGTRVDETIVVTVVLVMGLSFLSIRRWLELSRHLIRYEELYREMNKLNRESALLGELGDLLQSCLSVDEAHRLITDRAQVLFPGSSGAVCMTASSRDLVEVLATWGDGLLYLDGRRNLARQTEESFVQLSESQQRLARTFAEHAALALANLNLREIFRMQSVRDPLTGLYNRYMEESLERELRRSTRKKSSLGVMMLDIDHFKRFNDTFGHEAGDSVLRTSANLFRTQLRGEDVMCRYGGEETMILPEASPEATRQRAEHLREAAKHAVAEFRGQSLDRVTLSIGVSSLPENGTTGEALLRAADSALYRAKNGGRDCVVVA